MNILMEYYLCHTNRLVHATHGLNTAVKQSPILFVVFVAIATAREIGSTEVDEGL